MKMIPRNIMKELLDILFTYNTIVDNILKEVDGKVFNSLHPNIRNTPTINVNEDIKRKVVYEVRLL